MIRETLRRISILSLAVPGISLALQGGPTMPEYVKFEPYDVADIINLNTGDFVYSIPLGDVPGPAGSFPISMSYHSGVGHDQEATWVGLGWTLNPGAINRALNGSPDDVYNSFSISYTYVYERNTGWGAVIGAGWGPCGLNMNYDSHKGWGGSVSLGYGVGPVSAGMDIGTNGVSLYGQVNVGFIQASVDNTGFYAGLGYKGGGAMLAAKASMGVHRTWSGKTALVGSAGLGYQPVPNNSAISMVGYSFNSRSPTGGSVSAAGASSTSISSNSGASHHFNSSGFDLTIPLPYGLWARVGFSNYNQEIRVSEATAVAMAGYMYQGGKPVKVTSIHNMGNGALAKTSATPGSTGSSTPPEGMFGWGRYANFVWNLRGPQLENSDLAESETLPAPNELVNGTGSPGRNYWMSAPSADLFFASGPGVSGAFRPMAKHEMRLFQAIAKIKHTDLKPTASNYLLKSQPGAADWKRQSNTIFREMDGGNPGLNESDIHFVSENPVPGLPEDDFYFCEDGHFNFNAVRDNRAQVVSELNQRGWYSGIASDDECSPYAFLESSILNQRNRFLFSEDDRERFRAMPNSNMRFGFLNEGGEYAPYQFGDTVAYSYGSRQIIPLLEEVPGGTEEEVGRLRGFKIIDTDGKQFLYEKPVYSLLQIDYTTSHPKGMPGFLRTKEDRFSWQMQMTPTANQWLLTEVRGPDFIKISETDMSQNYGYQVKLEYTDPVRYNWRTPYSPPGVAYSSLPNLKLPVADRYAASMGQKELVYLKSIETATHKAVFNLNGISNGYEERTDAREWQTQWFDEAGTGSAPPLEIPVSMVFDYISRTGPSSQSSNDWEFVGIQDQLQIEPSTGDSRRALREYQVTYTSTEAYLPFKPSKSQIDYILANGIRVSGYNVAWSYYINYNTSVFKWVGPTMKQPAKTHSVVEIEPTHGYNEKYGAYRLKLSQPYTIQSEYRSWLPPEHALAEPMFRGQVVVGPNSWWEVDGKKYEMLARWRSELVPYQNHGSTAIEAFHDYAEELAPIPARLNLADIYKKPTTKNQSRYLKRIDLYKKSDSRRLRSFEFAYDNSLCKGTPNSFYLGEGGSTTYPPQTYSLGGKLTLLSVRESGYDLATGEQFRLPSHEFQYQAGGDFVMGGNPDYFPWCTTTENCAISTSSQEFRDKIVEATFKTDAYGMFNPYGELKDQKQRDASNQGVTWNLAKVTNPLGGELRIEYERDSWMDFDLNFRNYDPVNCPSCKGDAYTGCNDCSLNFPVDGQNRIVLQPMSLTFLNNTHQTDYWPNYFGGLDLQGAKDRFNFTTGTAGHQISIGETVVIVFKGKLLYDPDDEVGLDRIDGSFATTATVVDKDASGKITLSRKPSELTSLLKLWEDNTHPSGKLEESGFAGAFVYKPKKRLLPAGDVRVKSLVSCFLDCQKTAYGYEQGSSATRPDSVLSMQWISQALIPKFESNQYFTDKFFDAEQVGLGKNAVKSQGGDFDIQFLPNPSISYGKVTVANVNPDVCSGINTAIQGCLPNGKTVYRFKSPQVFSPGELAVLEQAYSSYTKEGKSFPKVTYFDYSSMASRPQSVSYYGSQWNPQGNPAKTEFYLVTKDSTEYVFGTPVKENWVSEKHWSPVETDPLSHDYHEVSVEYRRFPSMVFKQHKFQFVKKVPGVEAIGSIPHLASTVVTDSWDKLTGIVTASHVTYHDGMNPVPKVKTTRTQTMASLAAGGSPAPIPKEMARRNMLSQPLNESVEMNSGEGGANRFLDYSLFVWDMVETPWSSRKVIYRKGSVVPTRSFDDVNYRTQFGDPGKYYSTGYEISDWRGSLVQKVDRYLHPLEVKMDNGTSASSYYSPDGFGQVGFVLNSSRENAQFVTLNPEPTVNPDWLLQNYASYKDGNFFLQKPGVEPPTISTPFPLTAIQPVRVTFRAKSRTSNAALSIDFISGYEMGSGGSGGSGSTYGVFEGPQANVTVSSAWQTFSVVLTPSSADYSTHPDAAIRKSANVLRFFNDAASNTGLNFDILIDHIKVTQDNALNVQTTRYGETSLSHPWKLVSNEHAIYPGNGYDGSKLIVPLSLKGIPAAGIALEFRARSNIENINLMIGYQSEGGVTPNHLIPLSTKWKKYSVTLPNTGPFVGEDDVSIIFHSGLVDNQSEIEVDYMRAYPKGCLANSFILDPRGKIKESIDENQASTRYIYDSFGRLVNIKNDSGMVVSEQKLIYGKK